jgi:hypothetical protein
MLRAQRHIKNGELGRAYTAYTSNMKPATASEELVKMLQSKHPQRTNEIDMELNKLQIDINKNKIKTVTNNP